MITLYSFRFAMTDKTSTNKIKNTTDTNSKAGNSGLGLRGINATTLFKVTNFELFVKPNKYVMGFGLLTVTGCVAYLAYLNAVSENKVENQLYERYNSDGTKETSRKSSKWD